MSDAQAELIGRLARDLRPVVRLAPPWKRAALWLAAVAWLALLLSLFTNFSALRLRLMGAPDMWLSQTGAVLTAVLAGWAALQTAIPGRSPAWALVPLPFAVLWVGASAAGCLRLWAIPGTIPEPAMHAMACAKFLLLVSVPLAGVLGFLLLRACPLRPGLTACLAGLASAAAASALLALIHPFDATVDDLVLHLAAIVLVIGGVRLWGGRAWYVGSAGPVRTGPAVGQ
jgi:hypothetical protein